MAGAASRSLFPEKLYPAGGSVRRKGGFSLRLVHWTIGILVLLTLVAGTAAATHYRYGTLSWEPTENPNEVRFTGGQAWRASAFGSPEVGAIVNAEGCLQPGDGGPCVNFHLKVNARSTVSDWFSATFVDASGNEGFTYTYAAPNNNGQPFEARWGSCCRISSHSSGNYHVNNPDQSEALITFVDIAAPPNASPRTALPPINACPREAFCTIPIPSSDNNDDVLSYRLSSTSEAGDGSYTPPGPPYATHAAQMGAASGILSWDTRGATVGNPNEHTLYSVQIMIEDGRTQTPLDFFIEILPQGVTPPYWVEPPTPCGETLGASAGTELSFPVVAKSDGATRIVSVNHLGLPLGALFPPVTPANPASGTFRWTPTNEQAGRHLVVFAAEDDLGYPAPACPITIEVDRHPPPEFILPATCAPAPRVAGVQGVPLSFPVAAATVNASRSVTITLVSGPSGLAFGPAGPANPASGVATWAYPLAGAPPAVFRATDSLGVRVTCVVPFDIEVPMGQAFTLGAWGGNSVPLAVEYSSGGHDLRVSDEDAPLRTSTRAYIDMPQLGLHAEGITEWAGVDIGNGVVRSTAGSRIETLSLSNGAVVIHGLHQEATLVRDVVAGTHTLARNASAARVIVAGQELVLAPGTPTLIPIPGGHVRLFETHDSVADGAVVLDDRLVHVYSSATYGRQEAILGSVILQGGLDVSFRGQKRDILVHDDLGTGSDAGADRATALPLGPGLHEANMPANDDVDAYVFSAAHGEKVVFSATPAPGVTATGGSLFATGTPPPIVVVPAVGVAPLEQWRARLFDPTGTERVVSLMLLAGSPARVELNADLTGQWLVIVERPVAIASTNYTASLSVTPVPLLPQNDALAPGDAPSNCVVGGAGLPLVGNGLWPGVVRDDDFADTYRFTAEIGELITVVLKPGEDADGASMGIELYDRGCSMLASQYQLLGLLKGETRFVTHLPSEYTGDYFVRVVRLNGVANHYVDVSIVNPLPTVPMNDALTGQDAPADPAQAVTPPPVVFEGRLHEGDTGDAYRLHFNAGGAAYVAFSMSALSDADVRLLAPGGAVIQPYAAVGSTAMVWRFDAFASGDHILVVTPSFAGGNYAVTWGQLPVGEP